jgi:Flp pilus assembly protein TadG
MSGTNSNKRGWRRLVRLGGDRDGATMVDFAFLLPVMLAFSFGIIDLTLFLFDYHRAGEATRQGTRTATIVPSIVDVDTLSPGDKATCTSSGGTVSCGTFAAAAAASFNDILTRMQFIQPYVAENNVVVNYELSDVGDPATPGGALPLVTVNLVNMPHDLTMLAALPGMPAQIQMPTFSITFLGNGKTVAGP